MNSIDCTSCGQPMTLSHNFGVKPRGEKKRKYRVRRFHCDLCDIYKTVFASGTKDETRYMNFDQPKSSPREETIEE